MNVIFKNKKYLLLSLLSLVYLTFWGLINFAPNIFSNLDSATTLFTNTYGIIALTGGIFALIAARGWGGWKSLIGKSVGLFGLGLLAQEFGQLMYAYYIYVDKVDVPYPSFGDIGYFGSVILYIFAIYFLFKACGTKFSLVSVKGKLQLLIIPLLLAVSYYVFLRGYSFEEVGTLTIALDFGYPLLQAIYLALALLTFTLSRKYLGGIMRPAILSVLFALVTQYIADFSFLYQVQRETWSPGGFNDLIYLASYILMAFSLLRFDSVLKRIKSGKTEVAA